MRSPWALLLSASYGNGHNAACRALIEGSRELGSAMEFEMIDFFEELVSRPISKAVGFIYVQSVRHAPALYGAFYYRTARIGYDSRTQRGINALGRKAFRQLYEERRPDVVLSLHPTPAGAVSDLKAAGAVDAPLVTIVTDYAVHSQWIHPHTDLTVVGAPFLREQLIARGLAPERVRVAGIPISPKFALPKDRLALRGRWGFDPERPLVLVMAGAFGMMRGLEEILTALAEIPAAQAVFVCGHDRASRKTLERRAEPFGERLRVLGYTTEVDELMGAADLCITKAGGLTVTEALACGLPMLIYRPIPGQEEWNTRYLVEHGAGLAARKRAELSGILSELLRAPARLSTMSESARALARPGAAVEIAGMVQAMVR